MHQDCNKVQERKKKFPFSSICVKLFGKYGHELSLEQIVPIIRELIPGHIYELNDRFSGHRSRQSLEIGL